jgi:hypothetical protein
MHDHSAARKICTLRWLLQWMGKACLWKVPEVVRACCRCGHWSTWLFRGPLIPGTVVKLHRKTCRYSEQCTNYHQDRLGWCSGRIWNQDTIESICTAGAAAYQVGRKLHLQKFAIEKKMAMLNKSGTVVALDGSPFHWTSPSHKLEPG